MRLTLFSRLALGYLGVAALLLAVSLYAVFQLDRLNRVVRSLLETDVRLGDYEKKLTGAFLSQVRYERKFLIAKDDTLYDQFLLFQSDFERYLEEITPIADATASEHLRRLRGHYERYMDLVDSEVEHLRTGQPYPRERYRSEKEQATEGVLAELDTLKAYSEASTHEKMTSLSAAGRGAWQMTLFIGAVSLLLVVAISFLITRGIARPVEVLKRKTREIARGRFEADVRIGSPPEIAELAEGFNFMCRKLGEIDRMKTDFYSMMSHELRTPLTSIKEATGLLLDGVGGVVTGKQRRLLSILSEESNRLIDLVNSLLDLSKMEAGMMTYSLAPISLAPLIQKAMVELGPLAEAKRIRLESKCNHELPAINADGERILQVLRNLIGNALKFTPENGVVTVSAARTDAEVEVRVIDTGPGIPRESLATIFDKYRQGNIPGSGRIQGSGLGLAFVRHIITSHGGRVWADSESGQGSTFIFVLPV
ncbi:MAG: HAMP domain-containing histidine kinase [Deltaproteobacteria bacterium]|nr:HAMP domain-containing histidine kinase [Deltaproteobacteria bacterium]